MILFEWDPEKARNNLKKHGITFTVVHTDREEQVRIISARKSTKGERRFYESNV